MFLDQVSLPFLNLYPFDAYVFFTFDRLITSVKPGNGSLIAAGSWCPGKNELQTIRQCSARHPIPSLTPFDRNNIQRSSARLRQIISSTEFTKLFGEARPHPKGLRRNVFGGEDELKVAPKGVDKNHPLV